MILKTKGIPISTRHTLARRSIVTNHESRFPNYCISLAASCVEANRYTVRIEIAVTHSKQTTVVLSNRYNGTPHWGSGVLVTQALHCISTRYTVKVEFAVNPSRSTV
jgi:hypothetical protein